MTLKIKYRYYQKVAIIMVWLMIYQISFPLALLALTSGPVQPELQSFEPVGTTEMVDLFSGDFTYNIPLLEVPGPDGGYPINLFYNSVTDAEQEASMVGLGWNIGIGGITRQIRGLPDDFNGEQIKKKVDVKPNWTVGLGLAANSEIFGADIAKLKLPFKISLLDFKIMHNSYKGVGYSLDPKISVTMGGLGKNNSTSLSANFGLSLNSLEGVSSNVGFSIGHQANGENKGEYSKSSFGLDLGMNSREGLQGLTIKGNTYSRKKNEKNPKKEYNNKGFRGSANVSFERPGYIPLVSMPYAGENLSVGFKTGLGIQGFFSDAYLSGFFRNQYLLNRNKWVDANAYGYMYAQNAYRDPTSLMDFNREKDASIIENQPNLAIPISTPDVLSVVGHGIGGMYRPYRSDIGVLYDPQSVSISGGGSVSVDIGLGIDHGGIDPNINFSSSGTSRPSVVNKMRFKDHEENSTFEPYYLKAVGELSADDDDGGFENSSAIKGTGYLADDALVRLSRNNLDFGDRLNALKDNGLSTDLLGNNYEGKRSDRRARNMCIQSLTNRQLLVETVGENNEVEIEEILKEYQIKYYDQINAFGTDPTNELIRPNNDQIAGYTHLTTNGARWNFALPVMNLMKREVSYSVEGPADSDADCDRIVDIPGIIDKVCDLEKRIPKPSGNVVTDDFMSITETPAHASSFMLTSILGADYVDMNNNGPDDADRGYWMEIEYVKTTTDNNPYKWRSPFSGGSYSPGLHHKDQDDRASFVYGEREQYYPAKIKTKTHTAKFTYEKRNDARGAACWLQTAVKANAHSYKLSKIELYSNLEEDTPIKTVNFGYSYSLCGGVPNNRAGGGKLTLNKVDFTYENNTRGSLSPYRFTYGVDNSNPNYDFMAMDRWGTYRPIPVDANGEEEKCFNNYSPYVDQEDEATLNDNIAAWHLSKIDLPSGSTIDIDLGRDHYANVQDRTATQMFKIAGFGSDINNTISKSKNPSDEDLRIYFDLVEPIANDDNAMNLLKQYFEDLYEIKRGANVYKQLYFKTNVNLLNQGIHEDVTGYSEFRYNANSGNYNYGFDGAPADESYTRAYIQLEEFPIEIRGNKYHPMVVHNWQFLKVNLPDQMFGTKLGSRPTTKQEKVKEVKKLGRLFTEVKALFKNYYHFCRDKDFGTDVRLERSFIRLNTPSKKKFGGGVRVEKVSLTDDWSNGTTEPTYGTVYEYETEEEVYNPDTKEYEKTGRMISSGVATNEPAVGTDESALRYAKHYTQDFKTRTDNLFAFEYPVNESYYPGASIGYSKVTVKSIATDHSLRIANGETSEDFPFDLLGFASTGVTVHEFYTAKDFPIITKETRVDDRSDVDLFVFPFIGQKRKNFYTGTQGYSIEMNDMHGKQKQVSNYGQDKNGNLLSDPISWVRYNYQSEEEHYNVGNMTKRRSKLNNHVTVIKDDDFVSAEVEEEIRELGVERELFTDMRQSNSVSTTGGIDFNVDVIFAVIPLTVPIPWPEIGFSQSRVRTSVTNKVIRKSGILNEVVAFDGQSTIKTENLKFDRYTGRPLLTKVNNNFEDPIYNYTIPGHFAYEGMQPAYLNCGIQFNGTKVDDGTDCLYSKVIINGANETTIYDELVVGDEFILSKNTAGNIGYITNSSQTNSNTSVGDPIDVVSKNALTTAILMSKDAGSLYFDIEDKDKINSEDENNINFLLTRSGKRNLLAASVGSITTVNNDPTEGRAASTTLPNILTPSNSISVKIDHCSIDNVLSASAATFSDTWDNGVGDCVDDMPPTPPGCNCLVINTMGFSYGDPHRLHIDFEYEKVVNGVSETKKFKSIEHQNRMITVDCGAINFDEEDLTIGVSCIDDAVINDASLCNPMEEPWASVSSYPKENCDIPCQKITLNLLDGESIDPSFCSPLPTSLDVTVTYTTANAPDEDNDGYPDEIEVDFDDLMVLNFPFNPNPPLRGEGIRVTGLTIEQFRCYGIYSTISDTEGCNTFKEESSQKAKVANVSKITRNPYKDGSKGVWRTDRTYTYVADRQYASTTTLEEDGMFNSMPVFNWNNPFFPYLKGDEDDGTWKWTNEVTKYGSNGEEVENKNILGLASSAIYGYNDNVAVAVGANARHYELGYEGFEEVDIPNQALSNYSELSKGHIDLMCNELCRNITETHSIIGAFKNESGANTIWLDRPYLDNGRQPVNAVLTLTDKNNNSFVEQLTNVSLSKKVGVIDVEPYSFSEYKDNMTVLTIDPSEFCLLENEIYTGKVSLTYAIAYTPNANCTANISISNELAHTGKQSLKLDNKAAYFPQKNLMLEKGQEYTIGAWLAVPSVDHYTFENGTVGASINGTPLGFIGNVIDGWQRMEASFTYTGGEVNLFLAVLGKEAYFDDIRIFPKDGNIQTYVYDKSNYRLTEVLDNNNYFTRYIYDQEGNLVSVQKETAEGIKSLQESRTYVKNN